MHIAGACSMVYYMVRTIYRTTHLPDHPFTGPPIYRTTHVPDHPFTRPPMYRTTHSTHLPLVAPPTIYPS